MTMIGACTRLDCKRAAVQHTHTNWLLCMCCVCMYADATMDSSCEHGSGGGVAPFACDDSNAFFLFVC